MEKTINKYGKEFWNNAMDSSTLTAELFHDVDMSFSEENSQVAFHCNVGSITVLDRMTGFGWRDVETGFRAPDGKFWLASGGFDIRDHLPLMIGEAVDMIKRNANNMRGE